MVVSLNGRKEKAGGQKRLLKGSDTNERAVRYIRIRKRKVWSVGTSLKIQFGFRLLLSLLQAEEPQSNIKETLSSEGLLVFFFSFTLFALTTAFSIEIQNPNESFRTEVDERCCMKCDVMMRECDAFWLFLVFYLLPRAYHIPIDQAKVMQPSKRKPIRRCEVFLFLSKSS